MSDEKRVEPASDEERAHRIRVVLLRLEMVSHAPVQAWNKSGGQSGEPDDRIVALVMKRDEPPHLEYRRRYEGAHSITARNRVIMEAEDEFESLSRRTVPIPQGEDRSMVQAVIDDGEGWEPRAVAQRFNVDQAWVRRQRAKAGRGTEDGRPVGPLVDADRAERAREMRARGLTTRQIALNLSVKQTQVMRWIRAA